MPDGLLNGIDRAHSLLGNAPNAGDLLANLFRRLGCFGGEGFDLTRDDGKSLTSFSSPRRLDGGIEGEQARLVSNVANHVHHSTNFLR